MRKISLMFLLFSACLMSRAESISLSIAGTSEFTDPVLLTFTADGTGSLSPLGSTTLTADGSLDATQTTATGTFTFDFGMGDTLTGDFNVPSLFFFPGNMGTGAGTATILDGTGIYAGDTGTLNLTGNATATGIDSSSFTLDGTGTLMAGPIGPTGITGVTGTTGTTGPTGPTGPTGATGPTASAVPEPPSFLLVLTAVAMIATRKVFRTAVANRSSAI